MKIITAFLLFLSTLFAPWIARANLKPDVIEKIKAALPDKGQVEPKQARKLLVFSKTNGFRHGSIATGVKAMELMGEKTGAFTVTATEDDSWFESDKLNQFDAVLMLNTTGEVFRPKKWPADPEEKKKAQEREERLKKNLVAFVSNGKGLIGMHSATDTYKKWKEFNDMMGGAFAGHPWHMDVPIKNLLPKNPVNWAFSEENFKVKDEIYQFRNDTASAEDRLMLLALDPDWEGIKKGKRDDGLFPISWIRNYEKGRNFYCSLGHRNEIFYNPVVLQHYLAGIQFALGDLEADATPNPVK